jgi:hypothetical protein
MSGDSEHQLPVSLPEPERPPLEPPPNVDWIDYESGIYGTGRIVTFEHRGPQSVDRNRDDGGDDTELFR